MLMLDPTLPESRLRALLQQTLSDLIISSDLNQKFCSRLVSTVLVVAPDTIPTSQEKGDNQISSVTILYPHVRPSDLLYLVGTSGSIGTPKICMATHANLSTAVLRQSRSHHLDKTSRMYDFSSYSFDASHWSLLHTLCTGGVLCVPSEEQRRGCLVESLHTYAATAVFLTPTVARTIDPDRVLTLQTLYLGGEQV